MILPIYAYGQPVLRKIAQPINSDHEDLSILIDNMWETMYNANGVGLAAPQIGLAIRLFVIDSTQMYDEPDRGVKKVMINAEMIDETGDDWSYEEGCLSIPRITGEVERPSHIKIEYYDQNFEKHIDEYEGLDARVIQHEYDHIDGILFTDHLKPLKKRLINRKLDAIRKGNISPAYKMKFKLS